MDTYIYSMNGNKTTVIPHSDWYLSGNNIVVIDEINRNLMLANFNRENIAGVYSDNIGRLSSYKDEVK